MEKIIKGIGKTTGSKIDKFENFSLKKCDLDWSEKEEGLVSIEETIAHLYCEV
jgi:flavin reductase (DIM6/NTAB) family NADH-FMN oxidoreductase RutF